MDAFQTTNGRQISTFVGRILRNNDTSVIIINSIDADNNCSNDGPIGLLSFEIKTSVILTGNDLLLTVIASFVKDAGRTGSVPELNDFGILSLLFIDGHIAINRINSAHSLAIVPLSDKTLFSILLFPSFLFLFLLLFFFESALELVFFSLLKSTTRILSDSSRMLLITVGTD